MGAEESKAAAIQAKIFLFTGVFSEK